MRVFQNPTGHEWEKDLLSFTIGTLGGLTLGVLLSRILPRTRTEAGELTARVRGAARALRPARLRRRMVEQEELGRLEDAVLDGFRADSILRERGVDIGAISPGIIELSGSVWAVEEADRAVALANRIPGVRTVVNRLEIENVGRRTPMRRQLKEDDLGATFGHQEGRVGGMGRRRQSFGTDPDRRDDAQRLRENALAAADREQWSDEGLAGRVPRVDARPEVQELPRTRYAEDELDNQDPHGKHAKITLDRPPEELNSEARVGEGAKPRTELRLERSEVSIEETPPRDRER